MLFFFFFFFLVVDFPNEESPLFIVLTRDSSALPFSVQPPLHLHGLPKERQAPLSLRALNCTYNDNVLHVKQVPELGFMQVEKPRSKASTRGEFKRCLLMRGSISYSEGEFSGVSLMIDSLMPRYSRRHRILVFPEE